jgi:hypothetical protein
LLGAGLSKLGAAPAAKPPMGTELAPGDVLPVIDVHTHTRFDGRLEFTSKIPVTEEQYFKEWKDIGVVAAVSHVSDDGNGFHASLKDRNVFHCYGLGDEINLASVEKGLRSRDYRCIKVYLGYVHRWAGDPAYRAVYRLAQKYDVPVVFHTGDTYAKDAKLKYSDPLTIDEVAVDFPKVTFVIAHMGNPWTKSAAEVAYKNDNVYIEASAMLIGNLKNYSDAALDRFMIDLIHWEFEFIENPEKFMYGTDWPLTGMKDYFEAYKRAIPREHWCKVFYENAVKVFRLKELEGKYECKVSAAKGAAAL